MCSIKKLSSKILQNSLKNICTAVFNKISGYRFEALLKRELYAFRRISQKVLKRRSMAASEISFSNQSNSTR